LTLCVGFGISFGVFASTDNPDAVAQQGELVATFAGGCFWCVESDFDHVPGVLRTISGYTGGTLAEPTYKDVSTGGTGHREAVQIVFNPAR
jgi:peptide methionine sulfoxide reductase MsrA